MRALITGAFGFVGNHLITHLKSNGDEILGTFLEPPNFSPDVSSKHLDVCDPDECVSLFAEFKPDTVFHLAGIAFAPDAERNFSEALRVNAGGTYNIFRAARDSGLKIKIVVVTSAEVYGQILPAELPLTENTPLRPNHEYGLSKAMAELVVQRFNNTSNIQWAVMRAFNHIGPGQRPDFAVSSFAQQLASIAKGQSPPVMKVGNLEAQRDFTDVRDIVRGYRLAAKKGTGVYNLCSGKPVSMRTILDGLLAVSKVKVDIVQDPLRMRPSELPVLYGSYARAKSDLSWSPELKTLEDSLRDVYQYWLNSL